MKDIMEGISPLPWHTDSDLPQELLTKPDLCVASFGATENLRYAKHACNLYPELVEALDAVLNTATQDVGSQMRVDRQARAILAKCKAGAE